MRKRAPRKKKFRFPAWDYTGRLCEARVVRNAKSIGIPYRVEVKHLKHGSGEWEVQNMYYSRAEADKEAKRLNKLRSIDV